VEHTQVQRDGQTDLVYQKLLVRVRQPADLCETPDPADQLLREFDRNRLARIERAQKCVCKDGSRLCAHCQSPIDPERLQALPTAELCIDCKRQQGRPPRRYS
jgi:RNA polymerase-binding transcription factor DksA